MFARLWVVAHIARVAHGEAKPPAGGPKLRLHPFTLSLKSGGLSGWGFSRSTTMTGTSDPTDDAAPSKPNRMFRKCVR